MAVYLIQQPLSPAEHLRRPRHEAFEAILRTCAVRLRPVLLTTVTTILGLMPMVFAVNIDLINRDVSVGAPATQYWTQLSSSVAGGLAFATILTLGLAPVLYATFMGVPSPQKSRSQPFEL